MVQGMYEVRSGIEYKTYNKINRDSFTWKSYNATLTKNSYGLQELKFDLSDVNLKGTADTTEAVDEVINRIHVRLNQTKLEQDSFESCYYKNMEGCAMYVHLLGATSMSEMLDGLKEMTLHNLHTKTAEQ